MQQKKIVIAIDGFSSSGKSTMARKLAQMIGYTYIDSGAMYRAVTLYAMQHDMIHKGNVDTPVLINALPDIKITFKYVEGDTKAHTFLNGEDVEVEIRTLAVADNVSQVSAIPEVRHILVKLQQDMGLAKGIVMDGRDIGTTVFPDAEMKVFVQASPEVRAMRRLKELQEKGDKASYEDVLANIQERDNIDMNRKESPLRRAEDAYLLDNDNLSIPQQEEWLLNLYHKLTEGQQ